MMLIAMSHELHYGQQDNSGRPRNNEGEKVICGRHRTRLTAKGLVITACILMLFGLISCTSGPDVIHTTPAAQLDAQARSLQPPDYLTFSYYLIQIGDEIEVRFRYNPEFSDKLLVRPDGRITLPLIDEVKVVGLTPEKLKKQLTERYSEELKQPDLTVIVRAVANQKVFVDGEVWRAGLVPLAGGPLTVMQAIAQAGGFKDSARRTEVIVIRRNVDGPYFTSVVDVTKAIDGSDKTQDISLMPYDIVYVPKSRIAEVNKWVDQYIRQMLPIPIQYGLPYAVPAPTR
jgi:protein involved in polysaccharide export with SLBB domain